MTVSRFRVDPLVYVAGEERDRALRSLRAYSSGFSGRFFERLADPDPYRITASDIVAVSMLAVEVPAETAAWLLGEGQVPAYPHARAPSWAATCLPAFITVSRVSKPCKTSVLTWEGGRTAPRDGGRSTRRTSEPEAARQ